MPGHAVDHGPATWIATAISWCLNALFAATRPCAVHSSVAHYLKLHIHSRTEGRPVPSKNDGAPSVLVTGAAGGIGSCVSRRFAAHGYHVVAVDMDQLGLLELSEDVAMRGGSLEAHAMNLAECDEAALLERLQWQTARLTAAVLCAGMSKRLTVLDTSSEDFDRIVAANLRATFLGLKACGRLMRDSGLGGSIVVIGSINGQRPLVDQAVYSATKAAITSLATSTALELAPNGIRVNCIEPGAIVTPMNAGLQAHSDMSGIVPIPRPGLPDDIADAVEFLISKGSSYITATSLAVDGGLIEKR